jgi:glutaredoxin 3
MMSVTVYTKDYCSYCEAAKRLLNKLNIAFETKKVGVDVTREQLLEVAPNARTVPQIVIGGKVIGGFDELQEYIDETNFNGTGYGNISF